MTLEQAAKEVREARAEVERLKAEQERTEHVANEAEQAYLRAGKRFHEAKQQLLVASGAQDQARPVIE